MFNISVVLMSILRSTINEILSKFHSSTKVTNLLSIFVVKSVISSVPIYFNNSETLITCYKYNKPIDMKIDFNTSDSCDCQISTYIVFMSPTGHASRCNLNAIPDDRFRNIISKGPKYKFPSYTDFPKIS